MQLFFKSILLSFFLVNYLIAQPTFNKHIIDNNTHGSGGLYSCDLDDDGDMDILAAGLQDNRILWFENNGGTPIEWVKHTIDGNVGSAHSVYAADFDSDNDLDVIGAAYEGTPGIAIWSSSGGDPLAWAKSSVAPTFTNAHEIYAHDIDKDGDMDILGASSDLNTISWWRNEGGDPIQWTQQVIANNITLAKSVHAGDLDGDGDEDILGVSIIDNLVLWWRNDGGDPIKWTRKTIDGNFGGAHKVQAVDIDNDNDLDVVGAGYLGHQIAWWKNEGGDPVKWKREIIKNGFTNACHAHAVDIDNDGDNDIIGSSQGDNKIGLWLNNGDTPIAWEEIIVDNNFNRVWPLYATDLDGDGDIDIIGATSHNGNKQVRWYENLLITSVGEEENAVPQKLKLFQNYPNPFNPTTIIRYNLPARGFVNISIFNSIGEKIKSVVNKDLNAGSYEIEIHANNLSSGVYLYKMDFDNSVAISKKMVLLR